MAETNIDRRSFLQNNSQRTTPVTKNGASLAAKFRHLPPNFHEKINPASADMTLAGLVKEPVVETALDMHAAKLFSSF